MKCRSSESLAAWRRLMRVHLIDRLQVVSQGSSSRVGRGFLDRLASAIPVAEVGAVLEQET